jgi:dihydrofolate reductase
VVSDTLTADDTDPRRSTTRIVRRADAHEQVAELKRGDGGDILMFGSHLLWNDLLAHGLVDEFHLMIGPVVVGREGTPAFERQPPVPLRLIDARRLDGSENILTRYQAAPSAV